MVCTKCTWERYTFQPSLVSHPYIGSLQRRLKAFYQFMIDDASHSYELHSLHSIVDFYVLLFKSFKPSIFTEIF